MAEARILRERSCSRGQWGQNNAGLQGLLGHGKHFNFLPQSFEKPLSKGTAKGQICILKGYLCSVKNRLEVC